MAKGRLPPAWDEERMGPGDQMTREVGWGVGAIKAKLKGFGASELMTLVRDLHHASLENREFLRGRLLHSPLIWRGTGAR